MSKKYSFLAVADVHLGHKLYNIPELEEDLKAAYERAINKAIELEVTYFIVAGDLFDTNRPLAATIEFVRDLNRRLRNNNVIPLAVAGDHDKPIEGYNWNIVCDFDSANAVAQHLVGIDYSDNPAEVMQSLDQQVLDSTSIEFIFLHGMVPELWKFCEEKKLLPIGQWWLTKNLPNLKGFILGDIHRPFETQFHNPTIDQNIYAGYCGSLGVTKVDEFDKKGYLYYDGKKLSRVKYELERSFYTLRLTTDWLDNITEEAKQSAIKVYESKPKKPILLLEYDKTVEPRLHETAFLFDHTICKPIRVSVDGSLEETVNIRSELKTEDRIETALNFEVKNRDVFDLALRLIKSPEDAKLILDKFKEKELNGVTN